MFASVIRPSFSHVAPLLRAGSTPWDVHKFGGSSLATAALYKTCGDRVRRASKHADSSEEVPYLLRLFSMFYLLSSTPYLSPSFFFLPSIFYLISHIFYLTSHIFYLLSPISYLISSISYLLSSIFYLLSSVFCLLSSIFYVVSYVSYSTTASANAPLVRGALLFIQF